MSPGPAVSSDWSPPSPRVPFPADHYGRPGRRLARDPPGKPLAEERASPATPMSRRAALLAAYDQQLRAGG